ncbi:hypothetical protein SAY87_003994 [Trapa incisa]|uniref:Uncharacterized protein n=1 Tax=Trapa incisa TaxID=236973 RepID=A0AAN7PJC4_9MYRT|nr:hypothetical protein SAY87_003994 [Trapa incisa]
MAFTPSQPNSGEEYDPNSGHDDSLEKRIYLCECLLDKYSRFSSEQVERQGSSSNNRHMTKATVPEEFRCPRRQLLLDKNRATALYCKKKKPNRNGR